MSEQRNRIISKTLSYWLRHKPEKIGITIQENGWVNINELMEKSKHIFEFTLLTLDEIKQIVIENDKQRFSLNEDCTMIRANQGHSIEVKLDLKEVKPPMTLFHGAPVGVIDIIMKEGLSKMNRHHVHLSADEETAAKVGSRRGKFEILKIEAMRMRADGYKIYISDNGVYLVDEVPSEYIKRQ
jgi:putative RNA 2'-phosphotransferase